MLGEYDADKDGFIGLSEFIGDVRGDGMKWSVCFFVKFLMQC